MDIFALVAAFGGGLLGGMMGALPVFILTGVFAIGGGLLGLAGIEEFSVGYITFGSILGPHISFAGGVAAAAFAANKKKVMDNGADIVSSPYGTGEPSVLLVGGLFGIVGFLIAYIYGDVLHLNTDLPGMTVFTSAVIVRFMFGKTGLVGKYEGEGPRAWIPKGKELAHTLILGFGVGTAIAGVGMVLINLGLSDAALSMYPIVCFGLSATSLVFTQTGFATPATHYITLPAASATIFSGNIFIGIAVAIVCAFAGDVVGRSFNSHCDTHIDPPATVIFLAMFLINGILG